MRFDVIPLVGIGPVRLGMRRDDARAAMGVAPSELRKASDSAHTTDAYFHNAFQLFYLGDDPVVDFIEVSRDADIGVTFRDLDLFTIPAEQLIAQLSLASPFDADDPELGLSYIFPAWELALWRPYAPEADGDPDGRYFATVGIGSRGYYSRSAC